MSTQNTIARRRVFDAMAAQRQIADDAGRERPTDAYLDNILERMGELAIGPYKRGNRLQWSAAQHRLFLEVTRTYRTEARS